MRPEPKEAESEMVVLRLWMRPWSPSGSGRSHLQPAHWLYLRPAQVDAILVTLRARYQAASIVAQGVVSQGGLPGLPPSSSPARVHET